MNMNCKEINKYIDDLMDVQISDTQHVALNDHVSRC